MPTGKQEYDQMAKKAAPPSKKGKDLFFAFLFGGLICTLGQALNVLYAYLGFSENEVKAATPVTLIVVTAALTGAGVFDKIAKVAGAGTFVPITGFANAIVSPAMEFRAEGRVLGTGAKLFSIAGPVIVYGVSAAVVYGLIAYIFHLY